MRLLDKIKFSHKLWGLVIASSISLGLLASYAFLTIQEIKVNGPLYEKIVTDKDLIADILPPPEYLVESYLVLHQFIATEDASEQAELLQKFNVLQKDYATRHEYWKTKQFNDEAKNLLLNDSYKPAENFFTLANDRFLPAIQQGDKVTASQLLNTEIKSVYMEHRKAIDKIVTLATASSAATEQEAKSIIKTSVSMMFGAAVALIALFLLLAVFIIKNIIGAIRRLKHTAEFISVGNMEDAKHAFDSTDLQLRNKLAEEGDEVAALEFSFEKMTNSIDEQVHAAEQIASGSVTTQLHPKSNKDVLTIALNNISASLQNLISETRFLTAEANQGHLSSRGDVTKFSNGFREIIEGFNGTLDVVIAPIKKSEQALERVADGNLALRITDDFAGDFKILKDSINRVAESLNNALCQVSSVVVQTVQASAQIMESTRAMTQAAGDQSQQTSEVATAIEEMTRTIVENTRAIAVTEDQSIKANEMSGEGAKVIIETMKGMEEIVSATNSTAGRISALADKTEQIGAIVQVISDIAEQTNLLALNAAIESARAGEQGRGFAVVADEVRKLSERTSKATKEISETIKLIQTEAHEADKAMSLSANLVRNGMSASQKVSDIFQQLRGANASVKDMIAQVSAASEEQSATAEQISTIVDTILGITNLNVREIEQIAKTSESFNELANDLDGLVHQFELETTASLSSDHTRRQLKR